MHLSHSSPVDAYTFLRAMPPFKRWGLPEPDAVEFHIKKIPGCYGYLCFNVKTKTYTVEISCQHIPTIGKLLSTVAHEMCHIRQHMLEKHRPVAHGPKFKRLAAQVCRHHGFDPTTF